MPPRSAKPIVLSVASPIFAAALVFGAAAHGQSSGPFAALAGAWSGSGTLALSGGSQERIRCRAKYEVDGGGSAARLELRCASDSYKFELRGDVIYRNGEVQGNWNESTRGVAGNVTGTVVGNQVNVRIDSNLFAALLSLITNGNRQSISIQAPAGSAMSQAAIMLDRGS
ncbi:MAG: hypothetical protein WD073_04215 [Xanthobacteraceae bacterium]